MSELHEAGRVIYHLFVREDWVLQHCFTARVHAYGATDEYFYFPESPRSNFRFRASRGTDSMLKTREITLESTKVC